MTWICTLGSAVLGEWVWWFYLLVRFSSAQRLPIESLTLLQIPGFGAYKAINTIRPLLGMLLPGFFGPRVPRDADEAVAQEQVKETESRKQAKLRVRMEKGDKRVQQVQR